MNFLNQKSNITDSWSNPAEKFFNDEKNLSEFSGLNKKGRTTSNFSADKENFPEIVSILNRRGGEEVLLNNVRRLFPRSDYKNISDLTPLSRRFWENVERRLHSDPLYKNSKEIRSNKDSR